MAQLAIERFVRRDLPAAFALSCIALGGASAGGAIANAALQIMALLVIAAILLGNFLPRLPRPALAALRLIALAAALLLAQLVPLPPTLWRGLPGRDGLAADIVRVDGAIPWLPISLTPDATVATMLSLLVPLAAMLTIFAATRQGRARAIAIIVAAAIGSLLLGVAQVLDGPDSGLYPYAITNRGSAVGLFANRNHLATLLLCALPLAAVTGRRWVKRSDGPARVTRSVVTAGSLAMLASGLLLIRSVAGWAMLAPALAGAALLASPRVAQARGARRMTGALVGIAAIAAAMVIASLWHRPSATIDPDSQHRRAILATTLRAAAAYQPLGAGGGSFVSIYPRFEAPDEVTPEFINHAHDEYAETLLEDGIPGMALLIMTLLWWSKQLFTAFRSPRNLDAMAGSMVLAIVAIHSMVDYPIRSTAIAMLCGLAMGCIATPPNQYHHDSLPAHH